MRGWRTTVRFALGALFGLCAADCILQVRDLRLMPVFWENVAVVLFFLLAGTALYLAWCAQDRKALKRVWLWSEAVLLGSCILLVFLWLLLLGDASPRTFSGVLYALAVVSAPVTSCSVLFWPIFAWAVLLVTSHTLYRRLKKAE